MDRENRRPCPWQRGPGELRGGEAESKRQIARNPPPWGLFPRSWPGGACSSRMVPFIIPLVPCTPTSTGGWGRIIWGTGGAGPQVLGKFLRHSSKMPRFPEPASFIPPTSLGPLGQLIVEAGPCPVSPEKDNSSDSALDGHQAGAFLSPPPSAGKGARFADAERKTQSCRPVLCGGPSAAPPVAPAGGGGRPTHPRRWAR